MSVGDITQVVVKPFSDSTCRSIREISASSSTSRMCPAERGEADGATDIRQSLEGAETMPLSSGWARVYSTQVFSFVPGCSFINIPSLAHVTSREYRTTLLGFPLLSRTIVELPATVALTD